MTSDRASELDFYRALHESSLDPGDRETALAFARIVRELLLRIAAAQACQGAFARTEESLPGLADLFRFASSGAWSETAQDDSYGDIVRWLWSGFDAFDSISNSYQVWVGHPGSDEIVLCGTSRPTPPPAPIVVSSALGGEFAADLAGGPVIAIGHYDVHGLTMLALTLRTLRRSGLTDAKGIMGFEQTGDIGKLWKRTVPHALKEAGEGGSVVMIDCPVHSRTPEHTFKALRVLETVAGSRLIIIDHHPDTIEMAPLLIREGVQLVLTDVLSCGLAATHDSDAELRLLGAIADKVPEVTVQPECSPQLKQADAELHRRLLSFSPTPREFKSAGVMPCESLWEALAEGMEPTEWLASQTSVAAPSVPDPPAAEVLGSILFVTDRLTVLGRSWYGLLEAMMEKAHVHYAAALRVLDGNRANMLLLTHWKQTSMPPVRLFIPPEYLSRSLGHPAAVWIDLDRGSALRFLEQVAENLNRFFGTTADFGHIADQLRKNILEQTASDSRASDAE